ncbi:P2X purinoceptor 3a [Cyprinodon tularosa]|uniref:P2X purinoceptor 3a n=1 Tax=Cyprinodon tularosa TaxID=77115 RepID=UPI0018E24450|nr:P2X purinoceptor 3a [Cyprinodon tularosa]
MTSHAWNFMTSFLTYETNKSVVVKSWSVGIINRLVQLLIISYFVGYVFLYERAYQVADTAIESSVITKVKGFGKINSKIMDVADYIHPPQGEGVFSIITNIITTDNQVQGTCPEKDTKFNCSTDEDCEKHLDSNQANGRITGVCNTPVGYCEIEGWCPAEDDKKNTTTMAEFVNFTIFIKNSIRFPLFNVSRGNIQGDNFKCRYDKLTDSFCPIFRVGYILNELQQDVEKLASEGGEIGIKVEWICNLDEALDSCVPRYSFTKLNSPFEKNKVSKGYNFRFAKYYKALDGTDFRTLHKAFAVRFEVIVTGTARKFSLIPTVINVMAALTSIGMGTVLCDLVLLNCIKGAAQYKEKKFEEVSEAMIRAALTPSAGSQLSVK